MFVLETGYLAEAFARGYYAAAPLAAILADPFLCGRGDQPTRPAFQFSDLPAIHIGEPVAAGIILTATRNRAGGIKS